MSEPARMTVVVINYNGFSDLEVMLTTLRNQTLERYDVIFIDNASADESVAYVKKNHPWVRLLPQEENLGYARAANMSVHLCETEHIVFLNTDIRLEERCLEELLRVADSDPRIAAVGCKMRLMYQPKRLNGVGGAMNFLGYTWDRGMFEVDEGQYDEVEDVIFACGGAALFRRSAFLEVRGYDQGFYMYHEDVDLCWRLWLYGYRVVTAPGSVVYHHFSHSTRDNRGMVWRELIGERNAIRAMIKNYEWRTLFQTLGDMWHLPQTPGRKLEQRKHFWWNLRRLPDTLRRRMRIQRHRRVSDADLQRLIDPGIEVPIDIYGFIPEEELETAAE